MSEVSFYLSRQSLSGALEHKTSEIDSFVFIYSCIALYALFAIPYP